MKHGIISPDMSGENQFKKMMKRNQGKAWKELDKQMERIGQSSSKKGSLLDILLGKDKDIRTF